MSIGVQENEIYSSCCTSLAGPQLLFIQDKESKNSAKWKHSTLYLSLPKQLVSRGAEER